MRPLNCNLTELLLSPNDDAFQIDGTNPEIISNYRPFKRRGSSKINAFTGNIRMYYKLTEDFTLGLNMGKSYYNKKDRFFKPSFLVYNDQGLLNTAASNENAQLRLGDATSNENCRIYFGL